MRYGIPVLNDRVAPRCTYAESILMVVMQRNRIRRENSVAMRNHSLLDLGDVLSQYQVDTLICGGISCNSRDFLRSRSVDIIDNVVGTIDELLHALRTGSLRSGFGLGGNMQTPVVSKSVSDLQVAPGNQMAEQVPELDCLSCTDRVCLRGQRCDLLRHASPQAESDRNTLRMLEAALDISSEAERTLCRLSELVYFCLEMHYERIGVAYCADLEEPAEILVRVLRRFFEVFPVACTVGGRTVSDPMGSSDGRPTADRRSRIACNPEAQAAVLNGIGTDINVQVGICMGADCVFASASEAPVTTLFVKDRSLANNPIMAVYSDYYLSEATRAAAGRH